MDVGMKIRKLRKENKDSLKSLAKKIDYDWSNLSKMERGIYSASVEVLNKIINVYNVDPSYFLGEGFTEPEKDLLSEKNINPSDLKSKYDFIVDGVEASEKEIKEAIKLIRHFREGGGD